MAYFKLSDDSDLVPCAIRKICGLFCGFSRKSDSIGEEVVSKGLGVDFVNHPELLKEPCYAV